MAISFNMRETDRRMLETLLTRKNLGSEENVNVSSITYNIIKVVKHMYEQKIRIWKSKSTDIIIPSVITKASVPINFLQYLRKYYSECKEIQDISCDFANKREEKSNILAWCFKLAYSLKQNNHLSSINWEIYPIDAHQSIKHGWLKCTASITCINDKTIYIKNI